MVLKLINKTVKTNAFARKAPEINKQMILIAVLLSQPEWKKEITCKHK